MPASRLGGSAAQPNADVIKTFLQSIHRIHPSPSIMRATSYQGVLPCIAAPRMAPFFVSLPPGTKANAKNNPTRTRDCGSFQEVAVAPHVHHSYLRLAPGVLGLIPHLGTKSPASLPLAVILDWVVNVVCGATFSAWQEITNLQKFVKRALRYYSATVLALQTAACTGPRTPSVHAAPPVPLPPAAFGSCPHPHRHYLRRIFASCRSAL